MRRSIKALENWLNRIYIDSLEIQSRIPWWNLWDKWRIHWVLKSLEIVKSWMAEFRKDPEWWK